MQLLLCHIPIEIHSQASSIALSEQTRQRYTYVFCRAQTAFRLVDLDRSQADQLPHGAALSWAKGPLSTNAWFKINYVFSCSKCCWLCGPGSNRQLGISPDGLMEPNSRFELESPFVILLELVWPARCNTILRTTHLIFKNQTRLGLAILFNVWTSKRHIHVPIELLKYSCSYES